MRKRTGIKYISVHRQEKGGDSKVSIWEKIGIISNIILSVLTLFVTIFVANKQNEISRDQSQIAQEQNEVSKKLLELEEYRLKKENEPLFDIYDHGEKLEVQNNGGEITNAGINAKKILILSIKSNEEIIYFHYLYPNYYLENYVKYDLENSNFIVSKNSNTIELNQILNLFATKLDERIDSSSVWHTMAIYDYIQIKFDDYLGETRVDNYLYNPRNARLSQYNTDSNNHKNINVEILDAENYSLDSTYDRFVDDILKKIEN